MKRISIYTTIIGLALISSLSACLKDTTQPDFSKDKPVIELPIGSSAANGGGNSISAAFTINQTPSDYFVYVNYAAPDVASQDVSVTLAADPAAAIKFNQVNGTLQQQYTKMPDNGYTLPSNKITIPKGQRLVKFPVKINTINLDPNLTYAFAITITDGGGFTVSGNFGTLVSVITLKNKWDGVYTVTGSMIDQVNSSLTGVYPVTLQLVTQGANTVAVANSSGSFSHDILNAGSASSYGDFSPVFTIDPSTNVVTGAVNKYGQPAASNTRAARIDATGENKFTMSADGTQPVSLKVKYVMIQNGADRTFFNETWTYKSARP